MDFFDRQDRARRNTKRLVVYFVAGLAMLIASLYLVVWFLFAQLGSSRDRRHSYQYGEQRVVKLWKPDLFAEVAIGTLAVVGLGSLFKTMELSSGGSAVANMLGGRLINPGTADPDERKLLNVVEEMAIAAGIPVPQVYVLPEEEGINACAAGHATSDAAVCVTRGAMRRLTRDELQGVIGHEFSHILNGDMRLNLRLMGVIFGLVCLAVIGRILLQFRSGNSKDKNPLPLLGLALMVLGWAGVLFGRLIQAAVSRQREFLADASAVQFTRNPMGLAGALKKIAASPNGSRLESAHASEASHMFFSNGMGESFLHSLATHPPIEERIKALDPSFDGTLPAPGEELDSEAEFAETKAAHSAPPLLVPFLPRAAAKSAAGSEGLAELTSPLLAAGSVMPSLGTPSTAHLRYASELRDSFSPVLRQEARDTLGACALVYAMLINKDEQVRQSQLADLKALTSDAIFSETTRVLPEVEAVAAHARLPLVDMALPALRSMSPSQFQQFTAAVKKLVMGDGEVDLFEYVLQKIVLRHLEPYFAPARKPATQFYSLGALARESAVLLSALAYIGQDEAAKVDFAFRQGAEVLERATQTRFALLPAEQCGLAEVDAALDRFSLAVPQIKKNLIEACAQTVAADGLIQESEAELLRAVADTLDCPWPPFVTDAAAAAA